MLSGVGLHAASSRGRAGETAFAVVALAVLLTGCGRGGERSSSGASVPPPAARPAAPAGSLNILLVTVDTLRADHLGAYGSTRPTSPRFDAFAAEAVRFEREFSARSLTWPALTTILTGHAPRVHGVRRNGDRILPEQVTLPGILGRQGWATAAFRASLQTQPVPGLDEDHGSDRTDNWPDRDRQVTRMALEWLEKNRQRRFFAWLHYIGPHDPYQPDPPYRTLFSDPAYNGPYDGSAQSLEACMIERRDLSRADLDHIVGLYDGDVRATDEQFGLVLDALDRLGLADSTVVVFTADHGEELYQRNHYFLHGCSVYDSTLRVPLAIRAPGLPAGRLVDRVTESVDLAPTLLALAHATPPEAGFEGINLLPLIRWTDERERAVADASASADHEGPAAFPRDGSVVSVLPASTRGVRGSAPPVPGAPPSQTDALLWPTEAYAAAAVPLPADRFLDGERFAVSEYRDKIVVLRTSGWRYVSNPEGLWPRSGPYKIRAGDPGYPIQKEELYHTAVDPLELTNLAASEPELCARLREALRSWAASRPNAMREETMDAKTRDELKSLGYIH